MKHFGFTGTQNGCTGHQYTQLATFLKTLKDLRYEWLHSGDCIGADQQAYDLWHGLSGKNWGHPPDNSLKRAWCKFDQVEPLAPYLQRNKVIVRESLLMLAVPHTMIEELRSGTWTTVRYARSKRKPIIIFWPAGNITWEYYDQRQQANVVRHADQVKESILSAVP
jgi:hypothetical protein